jgi:hypothetical protein
MAQEIFQILAGVVERPGLRGCARDGSSIQEPPIKLSSEEHNDIRPLQTLHSSDHNVYLLALLKTLHSDSHEQGHQHATLLALILVALGALRQFLPPSQPTPHCRNHFKTTGSHYQAEINGGVLTLNFVSSPRWTPPTICVSMSGSLSYLNMRYPF